MEQDSKELEDKLEEIVEKNEKERVIFKTNIERGFMMFFK
jgi:hypothetical protein